MLLRNVVLVYVDVHFLQNNEGCKGKILNLYFNTELSFLPASTPFYDYEKAFEKNLVI